MANYPSFNQVLQSEPAYIDDRAIDQDVYGGVHIRSFFPAKKMQFNLKHIISKTDFAQLMSFYDSNRLVSFTFTWHMTETNFTCVFLSPPKCDTSDAKYYTVTVQLREA